MSCPAQHGSGRGDINGDGRVNIISPYGWWEQPPKGTPDGPWPYHQVPLGRCPRAGGSVGGAEMGVYDVNGAGLNDVVTSLGAHGWGLAWVEQKRDRSGVSHQESYTDPGPYDPAMLYWYRTVRNPKAPGGAEFLPEVIHSRSGAGSTVLAVDLNKDGEMDIVTSTNRGNFIFRGKPAAKTRAAKSMEAR